MITLRRYTAGDLDTVAALFYDTVHSVCIGDYTSEQLSAWVESRTSLISRQSDLLRQYALIAEIGGETVGFGSVDKSGLLNLLFVHKNHQRQGIAAALCDELEKGFSSVTVFASITAKPFFEKRGYTVIKSRQVERRGVKLKNFEMRKTGKV